MLPPEIGHAAAYEAYRTWIHNSSIYEPLNGEVQRQGLIGLAVGEGSLSLFYLPHFIHPEISVARLLAYAGRQTDKYARLTASETAAATASTIFYEVGF